jgi:guanylate kinase
MPELVYSVSVTTRAPRTGEKNGVHYFFVDRERFKRMIARGEFAEWALVHGHYYGTPRNAIETALAKGRNVVMDIDVAGKSVFDRLYPEAVGILVLPPSMRALGRRLRERKSDSGRTIRLRMANARKEIAYAGTKGKYEYTIVNENLERAKKEAVTLIGRCLRRG